MNTIEINKNEEFVNFVNYLENNENARKFNFFIFDEFKLIIKEENQKHINWISINDGVYKVRHRIIFKSMYKDIEFSFIENEGKINFIESPKGEYAEAMNKLSYTSEQLLGFNTPAEAYCSAEALFIFTTIQYIMNKSYERNIIQKEANERTNSETKKKYGKSDKVIHYLLNDIINYVSHSKCIHNIHCECWEVRGHFRHYKNGTVVWIRSYKKGSKRNEMDINSKKYAI